MSLDISLYALVETEIFEENLTHNLAKMAKEAGIYEALWCPDETFSNPSPKDLLPLLKDGLNSLLDNPELYKTFEPSNGWGTYNQLVTAVERYIKALEDNPNCRIEVSR